MEYISTTALANKNNINPSDLFEKLNSLDWIERKGNKWRLTNIGLQKGGQTKVSTEYGEYIVWPENTQWEENTLPAGVKFMNATSLGKHFSVSSQRFNLLLNELGWIEKTTAGWGLTTLGKNIGGRQLEHDISGGSYVLWPEAIIKNKDIQALFIDSPSEKVRERINNQVQQESEVTNDFRKKYPAEYRTKDGHYVRSKAELTIDDSLYLWGIPHAYEKKIPNTEQDVYSDFHIPSGKGRPKAVYIEYWGIENDDRYNLRKNKKIEIYRNLGLSLIQLNDSDIKNIEDSLQKYLLQHGIRVSLD